MCKKFSAMGRDPASAEDSLRTIFFPISGEFYFKLALFWCKGQNGHSSWRTANVFLNPILAFDLICKESG